MRWLAQLLWVRLPLAIAPVRRTLTAILSDGCYLVRWPALALVGPPVAVLYGVALSQLRAPGQLTYTYSILELVPVVVIAGFSASLGLLLTLAYAICDLALFDHQSQLLTLRPAELVTYLLLAALTVVIPLSGTVIRRRSLPGPTRLGVVGRGLHGLLAAVVAGGLAFLWTESAAVLIRPIFVWTEAGTPEIDAIQPLQQLGWILAVTAAAVAAFRAGLDPPRGSEAAAEIARALRRRPARRLPAPVAAVIDGLLMTLLLGGLLDSWWEVPVALAVLVLAALVRRTVPSLVPIWPRLLSRIPLVLRLALGLLATGVVGQAVLSVQYGLTESLWPVAASVIAGMVVMTVLVPDMAVSRAQLRGRRP